MFSVMKSVQIAFILCEALSVFEVLIAFSFLQGHRQKLVLADDGRCEA